MDARERFKKKMARMDKELKEVGERLDALQAGYAELMEWADKMLIKRSEGE